MFDKYTVPEIKQSHKVVQLNIQIYKVVWQQICGEVAAFASAFPQFVTNCKSERIVEIGCTFAKVIVKIEVALFCLGHGVNQPLWMVCRTC